VKRNNLLNCILILVIAVVSFSVYALFVCPILERVDSISKQILMSGIFCVFTVCVVGYFVFKKVEPKHGVMSDIHNTVLGKRCVDRYLSPVSG